MNKPLKHRRHMRMVAIQTLYQLLDGSDNLSVEAALAYALENGNFPDEGYLAENYLFLNQLVYGVLEHQEELDQILSTELDNWSVERLQKIDRVILRLALFEMEFLPEAEVPKVVAVDEAIELARGFSDDKSRQFVSGILMKRLNEGK
ncbi:transcription antitermination factor NusB [Ignavigranum ruoffiae]|uniref:transcription antitermination factor NusB n=1 Tax=Ignavigranum ruoffiae TaxID=89093 RepID=UPI001F15CE26|nr:transcription antitermination factor NusB [Ignavigranum ruoffiae]